MRENQPNGLAWRRQVRRCEEPLVRLFETDTAEERRAAEALERATQRALADPRAP